MAKFKVLKVFIDKYTNEKYQPGLIIEMTVKRAKEAENNLKPWGTDFLERIEDKEEGDK